MTFQAENAYDRITIEELPKSPIVKVMPLKKEPCASTGNHCLGEKPHPVLVSQRYVNRWTILKSPRKYHAIIAPIRNGFTSCAFI